MNYYKKTFFITLITILVTSIQSMEQIQGESIENDQKLVILPLTVTEKKEGSLTTYNYPFYVKNTYFNRLSPEINNKIAQLVLGNTLKSTVKLFKVLECSKKGIQSLVFSPDGKTVLTSSSDEIDRLWDLEGELLALFQGHRGPINSMKFSPDNTKIITISDDYTASLCDLKGNSLVIFKGHTKDITSVAFSPEGNTIMTESLDETTRLWDLEGKLIATINDTLFNNLLAKFSPDGKTILTQSGGNIASLRNLENNRIVTINHAGSFLAGVFSPKFSPHGKTILTRSGDGAAQLYDLEGNLIVTFQDHNGSIESAAFSCDGATLLTKSKAYTVCLWTLEGTLITTLSNHTNKITSAQFSPDGKTVVTQSDDKSSQLWDLKGTPLATHPGHKGWINSVAFSPNGNTILTHSLYTFADPEVRNYTAYLWNREGTLIASLQSHTNYIRSVAFSPDSKIVLTGSYDNTARLWDVKTGNLIAIFNGHTGCITSVAFSPNGKIILTESDNTLYLWNLAGHNLATLQGHTKATFSFDGKAILVERLSDNTLHLLSLDRLKDIYSWTSETMNPLEACFIVKAFKDQNAHALFDIFENTFEYKIFANIPSSVLKNYIEKWYYQSPTLQGSSLFQDNHGMGILRVKLLTSQVKLQGMTIPSSEDTASMQTALLDSCAKLLDLQATLETWQDENSPYEDEKTNHSEEINNSEDHNNSQDSSYSENNYESYYDDYY